MNVRIFERDVVIDDVFAGRITGARSSCGLDNLIYDPSGAQVMGLV